jgi:hypothetical protein
VDFTIISDIRFKKNVQPETHGLDFILKLQPIVYNLDIKKLNNFMYGNANDTMYNGAKQTAFIEKEKTLSSGFSAQQVEAVANKIGYNFSGILKPENEHDHYSLAYAQFVVPLVKAVQEQQEMITQQQAMIKEQQKLIEKLEARMTVIEKK